MAYSLNPNAKLDVVDLSDDTTVTDSGGTNTQTLTPPTGYIYVIRNIYYYVSAPAGDTSGTHKLECQQTYVSSARTIFNVTGNHSTNLTIGKGGFIGDSDETPGNIQEQTLYQKGGFLIASNSYPLSFKYTNSTDANQTGTRTLEILVEVKPERT